VFFDPVFVSFATLRCFSSDTRSFASRERRQGRADGFCRTVHRQTLDAADGFATIASGTKRSFVLNQDSYAGRSAVTPFFVGRMTPARIVLFSVQPNALVPCHFINSVLPTRHLSGH
jgi:hypothetical protein